MIAIIVLTTAVQVIINRNGTILLEMLFSDLNQRTALSPLLDEEAFGNLNNKFTI
jgi:hypothetical protein